MKSKKPSLKACNSSDYKTQKGDSQVCRYLSQEDCRTSSSVRGILKQYPDVGKEIEEFVQQRNIGADHWRRTGVLTFDGNTRVKEKVTYQRIREHLKATYNRKFSYDTIVQLCVPRNRCRRSAKCYEGVVKWHPEELAKDSSLNITRMHTGHLLCIEASIMCSTWMGYKLLMSTMTMRLVSDSTRWPPTGYIYKVEGRSNPHRPVTSDDVYPQ